MTSTAHLTTGWEPAVDVGDSLLRRYLFAWTDLGDAICASVGGRTDRRPGWVLSDTGRPAGFFNQVTLLAPPPDDPASEFDEIERAVADGTGEVHLWSAWPTPDLTTRGWVRVGHPPLLARPPAALLPPPPPPSVRLQVVDDEVRLAAWERVLVDGYPLPDLAGAGPGAAAGPALLGDPRFRLRLGLEQDTPVSLGASFVAHDLLVFALGVTLAAHRGRGHWAAHAADRLRAEPDRWAAGVFSDLSRPLAEAIGFVPLLRFSLWARPRP